MKPIFLALFAATLSAPPPSKGRKEMKLLASLLLAGLAFAQAPQYPVLPGGGGGGAVSSVFGRTGAVVSATGDQAQAIAFPVGTPVYQVLSSDKGKTLSNLNVPTFRFPVAATVGAGFYFSIYFDPTKISTGFQNTDGATVNGQLIGNYSSPLGYQGVMYITDGSNWYTLGGVPFLSYATSSADGTTGFPSPASAGSQDLPLMGGSNGSVQYFTSTVGRFTAQTAAKTVLTMTTTVATDASYLVSANVLLTAGSSSNFTLNITYTDESNTSRTFSLPGYSTVGGANITGIVANLGLGVFTFQPIHIRCKANTTITIATVGTFTTVTYNVEAHIRHIL